MQCKHIVLIVFSLLLLFEVAAYKSLSKPERWDVMGDKGKPITWGAMKGDYTSKQINELERQHRYPFQVFLFIWIATIIVGIVVYQLSSSKRKE